MHHWKNLSFLFSFGLRAVFVKGSKLAIFVSIVTSKRARWPPLFITFLSSSSLVTSVYQVLATIYVRFFYYGITLTPSLDAFMPCPCQYFTIVFVLFFVAVAVSSHLCVVCHNFNCFTLLLCGHVGFRNITLTGLHYSHLHVPFLEESNFCFRYQPFEL